jgi:hypothetical protein
MVQRAIAMRDAGDIEAGIALLQHAVDHATCALGAEHPDSLAAKGDMAAVLFELGLDEEASSLEREAFESARTHLGKSHAVTCVLAWNRALSYERCGDLDSARRIFADELAWLLAADPSGLETDQNIVRSLLVERFNWDAAKTC